MTAGSAETASLETAGELLRIDCELAWVSRLIREAAGSELGEAGAGQPGIDIHIEAESRPFEVAGWEPVTRGAWRQGKEVVLENTCASGFDMHLDFSETLPTFAFRWRPPMRERLARWPLSSRFHLLARAAVLQYPALWWAGVRGRAPLHASTWSVAGMNPLVAGAAGVGRSTLLLGELEAGGAAVSDNICVADGVTTWGLVEPLRWENGAGRRMAHGRRESVLPNRLALLEPDRVVLLRRAGSGSPRVSLCDPASATRGLVAATYMAGELARYWAFSATLAAGTGLGPASPPVEEIARCFTSRLPCHEVVLGGRPGTLLGEMLPLTEVSA
jgi:hypothetical protein